LGTHVFDRLQANSYEKEMYLNCDTVSSYRYQKLLTNELSLNSIQGITIQELKKKQAYSQTLTSTGKNSLNRQVPLTDNYCFSLCYSARNVGSHQRKKQTAVPATR
jgi:hypothetical protein